MRRDRELLREYTRGVGLLELSEKHCFPAVSLFRVILQCRGLSTTEVKAAIAKPHESKRLSDYDRQQLALAWSTEKERTVTAQRGLSGSETDRKRQSLKFEEVLSTYFEASGALLYREDELHAAQQRTYGGPVLTPDILFRSPVLIDGQRVSWVDAKDFYGSGLAMADGKHRVQVEKYTAEWGPGAVVFSGGLSDALRLGDDCLLLDGSQLPTSFAGTAMLKLRAGVRWGWRKWLSVTQGDDSDRLLAHKSGARVLAQQAKTDEKRVAAQAKA